ncbi:MAG: hypothetical protein ACRCXQ_01500 [Vagococcus fluvialis]
MLESILAIAIPIVGLTIAIVEAKKEQKNNYQNLLLQFRDIKKELKLGFLFILIL